jgi:hypothetical protein
MSILSFLLPNFNLDALVGLFILIIGIVGFVGSFYLPFWNEPVRKFSTLTALLGLAYWLGISFIQDLVANQYFPYVLVGVLILGLLYVILFMLPDSKKKKRK